MVVCSVALLLVAEHESTSTVMHLLLGILRMRRVLTSSTLWCAFDSSLEVSKSRGLKYINSIEVQSPGVEHTRLQARGGHSTGPRTHRSSSSLKENTTIDINSYQNIIIRTKP